MKDERLTDTLPAVRVGDNISAVIRKIVKDDRRQLTDVTRALLERGVAAYLRDGQLFEPEAEEAANNGTAEARPATITPRQLHKIGRPKEDRKKNAS